jgi:hypothetical protein
VFIGPESTLNSKQTLHSATQLIRVMKILFGGTTIERNAKSRKRPAELTILEILAELFDPKRLFTVACWKRRLEISTRECAPSARAESPWENLDSRANFFIIIKS